ncbi:hypothetical protein F4776DRAFT_661508 [Hypoxylon sp. NC0597]|nr:hypothetical protein F4776DRAFT_661508 [Hypoxylon sp. NC0597]
MATPSNMLVLTSAPQVSTCEVCKNTVPTDEARIAGFKADGSHRRLCYGCSVIPPAEQILPVAPYWSAVLNNWRPGDDSRAWSFIRSREHSMEFLVLMHQLSKYHTYKDVTTMLNSIAVERIRHLEDKRRHVTDDDWWTLKRACERREFEAATVHTVTSLELHRANLDMDRFGLVVAGVPTPNDAEKGVCAHGASCPNSLPLEDSVIFTFAYRDRRVGCDIIA